MPLNTLTIALRRIRRRPLYAVLNIIGLALGALPFVVTAAGALLIAGLTASVHALRAARTDPATTLRDE
ncbi:hypothetical protein [Salinibacter grassmerensis]|uniref:hypothetical protein n=1 Tax=Salinibacter grassmerensis TaxID=3040353 RepID=UPI0021E74249|nr:hypothetical protein [Salinibacter grassmerensis]